MTIRIGSMRRLKKGGHHVEILGVTRLGKYRCRVIATGRIRFAYPYEIFRAMNEKSELRIEAESRGFHGHNAVYRYCYALIKGKIPFADCSYAMHARAIHLRRNSLAFVREKAQSLGLSR